MKPLWKGEETVVSFGFRRYVAMKHRAKALIALMLCGIALTGMSLISDNGHDGSPLQKGGFRSRTYVDNSGIEHRYLLFVPHNLSPDRKPPVIFFLNGFGENGDDGLSWGNNFGEPVWEMKRRFPFLCVGPQMRKNGRWAAVASNETQTALSILDTVITEFDADRNRVYATGPSAGGGGVFAVAAHCKDLFAAIAPLAAAGAGLPLDEVSTSYVEVNLPVRSLYNAQDRHPGLVQWERSARVKFMEDGLSPLFIEGGTPTHNCWDFGYRSPSLYEWMLRQSRDQNANCDVRFQLCTEVPPKYQAWTLDDNRVLHYVAKDDGDEGHVLIFDEQSREFHFDYRSNDESKCEIIINVANAPDSKEKRFAVIITQPDNGSGGIYEIATSGWCATTDVIAQRALVSDRWNDVRVRVEGHHIEVDVNGWRLINFTDPEIGAGPCSFGFRVDPSSIGQSQWRYLRFAVPAG